MLHKISGGSSMTVFLTVELNLSVVRHYILARQGHSRLTVAAVTAEPRAAGSKSSNPNQYLLWFF